MSFKSDLFKRASFLRREELGAAVVSRKFLSESRSNKEIYIFDHDIIDSLCEPWRNGPQSGNRYGFGQVLPRRSRSIHEKLQTQASEVELLRIQKMVEDEDKVSQRILEILCEHVVEKTSANNMPIFQTRFYADRTKSAFDGLRDKVQRTGLVAGSRDLRQNLLSRQQLALVSAAVRSGNEASETEFIDKLIYQKRNQKNIGLSAHTLTIDRFDELTVTHPSCQINSEEFASYVDDNPALKSALSLLDDVVNSLEMKDDWSRHQRMLWAANFALAATFSGNKSVSYESKLPGISTLSWLYLANLECYRLSRSDIRFVFVTLDQSLVQNSGYRFSTPSLQRLLRVASRKALLPGEDAEEFIAELLDLICPEKEALAKGRAKDHPSAYFSLNFVRHIWGYLGDCFEELQDQGDDLRNLRHSHDVTGQIESNSMLLREEWDSWRNLFSGAFPDSFGVIGFKDLENITLNGSDSFEAVRDQDIGDVLDHYEELISQAIRNSEFIEAEKNSGLRKAISKAIRLQRDYDWTNLADKINDELTLSKLRALVSLSSVGAQVVSNAVRLGSRHPPNLAFESLPTTNRIFENLFTKNGYLRHGDFFSDFEKIVNDCWNSPEFGGPNSDDDREEIHLKLLVLGAAFASADRWPQAFQSSLKALEIVERTERFGGKIPVKSDREGYSGKSSFVSGREAYFLAAVAKRVSSKTPRDLVGDSSGMRSARHYLSKARTSLVTDHEKQTGLSLTKLRFDAEELGLSLAEYYMERYHQNLRLGGIGELENGAFVSRHEEIRELCLKLYADQVSAGETAPLTAINCATNILQACTSAHYRKLKGLGLGRFADESLDDLRPLMAESIRRCEEVADEHDVVKTLLVDVYLGVAKLIIDPTSASMDVNRQALIERIDEGSSRRVAVYDQWRYGELRWFVENCS